MRELRKAVFDNTAEFNKYYKGVKDQNSDIEIISLYESKNKFLVIYYWYIF